ncbi:hypothetical protein OCT51_20565 [Halomonas sp. LR3S48]|uniref:hypothetical protein n=1 Tax=Halomonas sp. LR3S48 TaxID=2982694 RepID=UPI0021E38751|nr:hypothetical protein [Halomonas sp. LR3S48]UYG03538.1 hypothetical protein OCT51_20565 [Halomonas sp. LR3S48]
MSNTSVVLRYKNVSQSSDQLQKLSGEVYPSTFVDLISRADLEANPRNAKVGPVTNDIEVSLVETPQIFHYKTKGVLIAARSVESLERNRFKLTFEDEELEGILDGGHNTLAIARHMLRVALGDDSEGILKKLKTWQDLQPIWQSNIAAVEAIKNELNFLIPVEIIHPAEGASGEENFNNAILDINRSRNNNAQLPEATKAHKAGYYDQIKKNLDPKLRSDVEWKANDGGRVKSRDLVALALVPISQIPVAELGKQEKDAPHSRVLKGPQMIFSSKGLCVSLFNDIVRYDGVSAKVPEKGEIVEVVHRGVASALALMADLPRLYDLIYELMPEAASNAVGAKFGRVDSVRIFDPQKVKSGQKKYLTKHPETKFFKKKVKYDYPEGFIIPLVWALRELMEYTDGEVKWKVDPDTFIRNNLDKIMGSFYGMIVGQGYDPAKVGKERSCYQAAQDLFRVQLILQQKA